MEDQYSEVFKQKTAENFEAFSSLYSNNLFNAASNRIYYCLIHAALTKAFKTKASKDCYSITDNNGKIKINKSRIRGNLQGIGINNYKAFRLFLAHAEGNRNKADYSYVPVIEEDFEDNILDKLRKILTDEGVLT